jgi:CRISPR system Cascade subunit CasE
MYLSRLILNPRSRRVQRDLADCHDLHRSVMSGFPDVPADGSARAELGVLYRIDGGGRRGQLNLLVQSRTVPDWTKLPDGYLLETGGHPANPACKAIDDAYGRIEQGRSFVFRLRANPTKRIKAGGDAAHPSGASKRVDLRSEEDRLSWLKRKGEQGGFQVLSVRANPDAPEVANARVVPGERVLGWRERGGGDGRQRMTFGSVLFEGVLRVTDAAQFRTTLASGIGSGKAYGFGLLSIAAPRALEE